MRFRIPAFTVLLLMAVFSVVGISVMPLLNVQYVPSSSVNKITVSYIWPGASPAIIENDVTSLLEGVLSSVSSNTGVSSLSGNGHGNVEISFRKGTDMEAARFEVATCIRNIYPSFPKGVSYPNISAGTSGIEEKMALLYEIKGDLPTLDIYNYLSEHVTGRLSEVEGTGKVQLSGAVPFEWAIRLDSDKASVYGITPEMVASVFNSYFSETILGMTMTGNGKMSVKLANKVSDDGFGAIPVSKAGDRIIYLRDIADIVHRESQPSSYYRINGLNTISLSVNAEPNTNIIDVAHRVHAVMNDLSKDFPDTLEATLSYDASEYISKELDKIYFRTALCLLILMAFVFVVSRSWRYVAIISATLAVNIFIAVAMYFFLGLDIHIYTLAGITVSLGIIIDSSIVMTDHYGYYRNRAAFPSLLGAVATTIAALGVIFLLPESSRVNLSDFAAVISVNLCVSLVTAYLFVPSLMDRFPVGRPSGKGRKRRLRRIVRLNRLYERYIIFGVRHKWLLVLLLIAAFGIPTFMLPGIIVKPLGELSRWEEIYNKFITWTPYASNRDVIDKVMGSSFGLFSRSVNRSNYFREPGRQVLTISGKMPEGCTVAQMNEVMGSMESFLSGFDEIESFVTEIRDPQNGFITVYFKPEYEKSVFPSWLKSQAASMAVHFGGATWVVSGIDDLSFSNDYNTDFKSNKLDLYGYNCDDLIRYSKEIIDYMSGFSNVMEPELVSGFGFGSSSRDEYNMSFDGKALAVAGTSPYSYYSVLASKLYNTDVGSMIYDGSLTDVVLESSDSDSFDLWYINNVPVRVDSVKVKLSGAGNVRMESTGLDIFKKDQSYLFRIAFNYSGRVPEYIKFSEMLQSHVNSNILPMGFKLEDKAFSDFDKLKDNQLKVILLIAVIIYVMCSMIFNSLRLPIAIMSLIPVSFIGVFLTFGIGKFPFDQGGFAAFVMLSGTVVNACIYIINAMGQDKRKYSPVKRYLRAFNHKINAIILTVVSTVLGLVPFLFDGPSEVFWFAFAIATIGGMFFSLIALVFYLPVFCFSKKKLGISTL